MNKDSKVINKDSILVGSDFEMFLTDKNGKFVSSIPFNEGTKDNPEEIEGKKGCCIQRDGVLQECNVPPVKLNQAEEFWNNVQFVRDFINKKILIPNELELKCCASARFEEDQLIDPEAALAGCSPDYNAWKGGEMNDAPQYDKTGLRCCGAHAHFSYENNDVDTSIELMKCFDVFATVPFIILDKDIDRRTLYGKAGAFRIQNWNTSGGFEARTLSNYWLSSKETVLFLFDQLNQMFDYFNQEGMEEINKDADKIIECINNADVNLAYDLCEKYKIALPELIEA